MICSVDTFRLLLVVLVAFLLGSSTTASKKYEVVSPDNRISIIIKITEQLDDIYDSILEFSVIERFLDAPLKTYSSGMAARLRFAIAINVRPDIVLIDEVLAVGDGSFRKKCNEKTHGWKELGRTIVLVSHSMSEIKHFCDRAVCLDKGRIVFKGSSSEAADFYLEHIAKEESQKVKG